MKTDKYNVLHNVRWRAEMTGVYGKLYIILILPDVVLSLWKIKNVQNTKNKINNKMSYW